MIKDLNDDFHLVEEKEDRCRQGSRDQGLIDFRVEKRMSTRGDRRIDQIRSQALRTAAPFYYPDYT
jgi:hypothetical protein